jgi:hypothetical protein
MAAAFNPQLWSKKLNAKYYVDNQLTEITNTKYEGEIKNQGDTVRIRTVPTLTISDYSIGSSLQYEVPTPVYQDMLIEKAKSFAFQVNDIQEAQSDLGLLNMYMEDAAKQLKISIANEVYYSMFCTTDGNTSSTDVNTASSTASNKRGCAAANQGATAGVQSSLFNLGVDGTAIDVTGTSPIETKGYVPERSVVIPGSYTKTFPAGDYQVPCALIIGKRKESTDLKTSLNDALRDNNVSV